MVKFIDQNLLNKLDDAIFLWSIILFLIINNF